MKDYKTFIKEAQSASHAQHKRQMQRDAAVHQANMRREKSQAFTKKMKAKAKHNKKVHSHIASVNAHKSEELASKRTNYSRRRRSNTLHNLKVAASGAKDIAQIIANKIRK